MEAVTGGRILQSGDTGNIVGAVISDSQGLVDFDYMVRGGAIAASINSWQTLKAGLLFGNHHRAALAWPAANIQSSPQEPSSEDPWVELYQNAMDDDLNTSGALAVLFELAKGLQREGNRLVHEGKPQSSPDRLLLQWQTLWRLAQVLGLEAKADRDTDVAAGDLDEATITDLIQQRQTAR